MPVVISFTVETDGRLPSGQPLGEAVTAVDRATHNRPAYYMLNCAHPSHFEKTLAVDAPWLKRLRAIRANASAKSHAELDEATELDAGNPDELGRSYADLKACLPQLTIFGGCCGTDHRHVAAISRAVASTSPDCRLAA
jgi:S-methylmethionine-dependent homocysteine/selenocysteine methylase